MDTMFVRPGADPSDPEKQLRVRLPSGELVPAEGMVVTPDLFIRRRLADGDLVPAPAAEPHQASAPDTKAKGGRTNA